MFSRAVRGAAGAYLPIAILCAGCESPTDADSPQSIRIAGPSGERELNVAIGGTVPLVAFAKNASGMQVSVSAPFAFVSRNSVVARVDSLGVITAASPGVTLIVAKLTIGTRTLSDSVVVVSIGPPS